MVIRMLGEQEVAQAADLAQVVYRNQIEPYFNQPQMNQYFYEYAKKETLTGRAAAGQVYVWGAFEGANMVGMSAMQPEGHVTLLYVLPQYQKRGMGKAMLLEMKRYAFEVLHLHQLTLSAMPAWTANYFARNGYVKMITGNPMAPYISMVSPIKYHMDYTAKKWSTPVVIGVSAAALGFVTVVGILYGIMGIL